MWDPRYDDEDDPWLAELNRATDADEVCRQLVVKPWDRSSSRYADAVDVLRRVGGTGTLPGSLPALLLCTCQRWRRVTAKLIAAIEESGLLGDADLDELAESLLSTEITVAYPLVWVAPKLTEINPIDGSTRTVVVDENTVVTSKRRAGPPLRRWAATRALRNDPGRLEDLLASVGSLQMRDRDAFVHGLLDAAGALHNADDRRRLMERGLRGGDGPRTSSRAGPALCARRSRGGTTSRRRRSQPGRTGLAGGSRSRRHAGKLTSPPPA